MLQCHISIPVNSTKKYDDDSFSRIPKNATPMPFNIDHTTGSTNCRSQMFPLLSPVISTHNHHPEYYKE